MSIETTTKWQVLFEEANDEAFQAGGKDIPEIYTKYLKTKKLKRGNYKSIETAGLTDHQIKPELQETDYDQLEIGEERTSRVKTYGLGIRYSKEFLDDLREGHRVEDYENVADTMKQMKRSALRTREKLAANLVLQGDSADVTDSWNGVGRDGVALFSSAHTQLKNGIGNYSNIASSASLSLTTLLAAVQAIEETPDATGTYQAAVGRPFILCSPYWRTTLYEILNAKGKPGDNHNDANALDQFDFQVIFNPYLGTTNKNFVVGVMDERYKAFYFDREREKLEKDVDHAVRGIRYFSAFRGGVDFLDPRGLYFNAGG